MPDYKRAGPDNTLAEKHGLYKATDKLWKQLDDEECRLVGEMSNELVDRYEYVHAEPPGTLERESMRNMLVDVIKRRRANEWMFSEGLLEFDTKERHQVYSTILNDYYRELESLGLAKDAESDKYRAEADWFQLQQEAEENGEEPERHRGHDPSNYEDVDE